MRAPHQVICLTSGDLRSICLGGARESDLCKDTTPAKGSSSAVLPFADTAAVEFHRKHSRFQGSGFRVQGSGFRVQGPGFRVKGSGHTWRPCWQSADSAPPAAGRARVRAPRLVTGLTSGHLCSICLGRTRERDLCYHPSQIQSRWRCRHGGRVGSQVIHLTSKDRL